MKRFTYIKPVEHVQIGHVYEHLYAHQLAQAFRAKGLFAYVDYDIDAKTFYRGFVQLEVFLYSKAAEKVSSLITDLKLEVTQDTVAGALLQIMAEKHADVYEIDYEGLIETINEYSALSWVELEDISVDAFKAMRRTTKHLKLTNRSPRNFLNLNQIISLDLSKVSLDDSAASALFVVIADVLRTNLQEDIADKAFCYSSYDNFVKKHSMLTDMNVYRIDKRQATTLKNELAIAQDLFKLMHKNGMVKRLSEMLMTSRSSVPYSSPSRDAIYQKVQVLIGDKGWHEIGTEENIQEILKATTIQFKLAKSSSSIKPVW